MRRFLILAVLLAACASSGPKANVPAPEFSIEQTFGPADAGYPTGPIEVQYRLEIANRADVPLTLKRITMQTVNPEGGAYSLTYPRDHYFNVTIPAKSAQPVEFSAHAYGYGRSLRETEPVTVRGVAYFSSPSGYVNQPFVRELGQMP